MNTNDLSTQVNSIIYKLHSLFDDIGVDTTDRHSREQEVFTAISETLEDHLQSVALQKENLVNEAELLIKNIHLFEAAIYDKPPYGSQGHESLQLSKPLNRCVHILQEKHRGISQQYQDRLDQVNRLVSALSSYASHLEAGFLRVELPPAGLCAATPTEFSLSPSYLTRLDAEFGRVHQEYNRRLTTVQSLAQEIITLWAELGTPQAQTDPNLIKHHRDSPEQLGLRSDDLSQLEHKLAVLHIEKQDREAQLSDVKRRVETLWELLQLDDEDIRAFKSANRGFGLRVINEYEAELDRLHERKRQHLGLFIEDARCKIQQLWDDLFFSEEEMIEFTPAFQDVPTDALLAAHETEIDRLQALSQQRAPILDLLRRYRTLIQEKEDLAASSQDASRLMLKGARGEKRDPTRLLREEKMRKRIAKELPKVTQDLQHKLEQWERDYDRPFLVKGVRFLEEIEDVAPLKPSESARSKTPSMPPPITRSSRTQQPTNLRNMPTSSRSAAPSRAGARTPMQPIIIKGAQNSAMSVCSTASSGRMSPTKIPGARKPFAELGQQPASPRRHLPPTIKAEFGNIKRPMQLPTAPPPRMRDLPEHKVDNYYYGSESQARCESALSSQGSVRHRQREDMFGNASEWEDHQAVYGVPSGTSRVFEDYSSRLPSATSATTVSGSENWETYDDGSENEANGGDQRRKQADQGYVMAATAPSHGQKHAAAVRSMVGPVQIVGESGRLASGSEAGWTDASGEVF